jgi:hypothetical protein
LEPGAQLGPEREGDDLLECLERFELEERHAVLAGYARAGYELLDGPRPGHTDALLDHLGAPEPRPRPMVPPFDVPGVMGALGVELCLGDAGVCVGIVDAEPRREVWRQTPASAFSLVVALLVAGVDCRPLFERDRACAELENGAYGLLWPNPPPAADIEAEARRGLALSRGFELAAALGRMLRLEHIPEPFDFNHVIFWVRRVLHGSPSNEVGTFGDLMLDVTRRCARLAAQRTSATHVAAGYLQRGVIILEYMTRGQRADENRLVALTQSLHALPGYPSPLTPRGALPDLGLMNSLLITLRELSTKSLAEQESGRGPMLRSAAVRGLALSRHALRVAFQTAMRPEPEAATHGLAFLKLTLKNYATLLFNLASSAKLDHAPGVTRGWSTFFGVSQPSYLDRELTWITEFLSAAAAEGFSLDAARRYVRAGSDFLLEDNTFTRLPERPSMSVS